MGARGRQGQDQRAENGCNPLAGNEERLTSTAGAGQTVEGSISVRYGALTISVRLTSHGTGRRLVGF
jgi:hypothetical protein